MRGRVSFICRLVGEDRLDHPVEHLIQSLALEDRVEVSGRVDQNELYCALLEADLSICLRKPTLGESSGIVMRSLACGTPVVVNDAGWFSELPDEVAIKVPFDDDGGRELDRALEEFIADPARQRKMADAAMAFAQERTPSQSARGYADFVQRAGTFPHRWAGRGFQRIAEKFRDLDVEWPGCAAKHRAAHYLDILDWNSRSSDTARIDRRARRLSRLRTAARADGQPIAPRRNSDDDQDTTVAYDVGDINVESF